MALHLGEAFRFSIHALASNRIRTFLTALGLVIGNASVILVVTISLASRDYILEQISGVGSNLITAYYELGNREATTAAADFVKIADVEAVRETLASRIRAASGVMVAFQTISIQGRLRDVQLLGTDHEYPRVRNLVILAGRTLDFSDVDFRQRVAVITQSLAERLYGNRPQNAIGQTLKLYGLQFTIVGVFREKTDTFGLSEVTRDSVLVPITVLRLFVPYERVDPMYVSARNTADVPALTEEVRRLLESRHRKGANFYVGNLTAILEAAEQVALAMTVLLILISVIALVISGIGIMNIMLVTVTERTREIGLRMALGGSREDVTLQFLLEAMLISAGGGLLGVAAGVAVPLSVRYFTPVTIPISPVSVAVAFVTSFLVGLLFGLLPARRAAALNPTEALRYE
jgi:putative ABC transport system permease protein